MTSLLEKGGGRFHGLKLLLCENPLPPLDEAIAAARAELPRSNHYTEPHSAPLRRLLAEQIGVPERLIHINAGSELILRQIFDRFGQKAHLLTPTYVLFPEIAQSYTETRLSPDNDFAFDLGDLEAPEGTTLVTIVNPNNPNGGTFDMEPLPRLLRRHPSTFFLVDEAFIGLAGQPVARLVASHANLLVTRTLSKAHSLAGFRIGYAVMPEAIADEFNRRNDAYPLARASEAAALATLRREDKIRARAAQLRTWTRELADRLGRLGVRTFPTETYFFLADFAPHDARDLADELAAHDILVKPLDDRRLGPGFMRVTTSLPADNARFAAALADVLRGRRERSASGPGGPRRLRIAVAAQEGREDADVSSRAGRAPYFFVYDGADRVAEVFANPFDRHEHGMGVRMADFLAGKGVRLLIARRFGKAFETALRAKGLDLRSRRGSVRDAAREIYGEMGFEPVAGA